MPTKQVDLRGRAASGGGATLDHRSDGIPTHRADAGLPRLMDCGEQPPLPRRLHVVARRPARGCVTAVAAAAVLGDEAAAVHHCHGGPPATHVTARPARSPCTSWSVLDAQTFTCSAAEDGDRFPSA